ncbi:hypothetical protein F4859DRAFT_470570 [Xylaria cf. heliscus]|nr:hypothetical protein F4859DRAFT_470570 [Xylaria cf. heliscus]
MRAELRKCSRVSSTTALATGMSPNLSIAGPPAFTITSSIGAAPARPLSVMRVGAQSINRFIVIVTCAVYRVSYVVYCVVYRKRLKLI